MKKLVYYIGCFMLSALLIGCNDEETTEHELWMPSYILKVALIDKDNNMLSDVEHSDFWSGSSKSFSIKAYFDDESETQVTGWGIGNHNDTLYLDMRVPYVVGSPIRKVTVYLNYPNAFADSLTHKFEAYYVPGSGPGGKHVVPWLNSVTLDGRKCEKLDWDAVVAHLE
ncbi:MAG: hypothetical protein NC342_04530 [Pseudoflavonifractor sp.]|nr:hypothetical protein [Alloprevotella sp.]MCM1116783.1 hypothetical protein [Pseudoflavonifractor sp.]